MVHLTGALPQYIPSPPISSFHIGPLDIRFYALGYIIGITLAILITRRRWRALGGNPDVVNDIALWAVPAGIIGGRIYFDITTPPQMPRPPVQTANTPYHTCGMSAGVVMSK